MSKVLSEHNILLTAKIPKLIVKFATPALIAMLVSGVQGMVDGMFVGNVIGPEAMASVNIAIPFLQLIIGLSMIISIGSQSHIGLMLGMGKEQEAKDTFQTFLRIITVMATGIMLAGSFFYEEIARIVGADAQLLEYVSTYIRTLSVFAIPMCIMFYLGFLNRIIGRPELYFWATVIGLLVNITMNYLLIVKLDLGIFGAACATGISYTAGLLAVIKSMLDKKNVINIRSGKFLKRCIVPVFFNGASEGINSISIALTIYLFNMSLMKIAGAGGVAAFTAINYIGNFGILLLFGISDGVGPIVSYNYGHGGKDRVKQTMKIAYIINLFFGILVFLVLFFLGGDTASLFIKESPEIIELAREGGKIYGLAFFMAGFNILNSGYFTFIGRGLASVVIAASRGLVFVSFGILVFPHILGTAGIWISVPFAEMCAMLIGFFLLHRLKEK